MNRARILGLSVLSLTGIYVYTFPAANIPFFAIELAHILGGLIFALVLLLSLRSLGRASVMMKTGWILIGAGAGLGVYLTFTGTTRPMLTLLYQHIFLCVAGLLFLLTGYAGNRRTAGAGVLRFASFLILALLVGASAWAGRELSWRNTVSYTHLRA